ncbi:MAG: prepilin peptidase [Sedimentisphaerales bacterium]|nr:prepilin peptidase [Sedimentisphaerales bacterium]
MAVPAWIWFVFIFAFGCCIGSFLNVVIYRLPRDKSLVTPPSACPACGKHIRFYDNIPLLSWLLLGRKCRYCKVSISPRYFIIELLTGLIFLALFILYFHFNLRDGLGPFLDGGWSVYLLHIIMLGAFIAASAIDLELWIIPLCICWFVTAAGFIGSSVCVYIIDPALIREYSLLPRASADTGALAVGATAGLIISLVLIMSGILKRSYEPENSEDITNTTQENTEKPKNSADQFEWPEDQQFNHRLEAYREILFLLPIIVFSIAALWLTKEVEQVGTWWVNFSQHPAIAGLLGSIWGYFTGCGIVWGIRIFGTLAFGKEAMGLGDVHLMGAAGAVIGPVYVVVAFFVAPFFGLAWAAFQMFFKKIRQIPYGPFLSLGIFVVIILHDWIRDYMSFVFYR